MIALHPQKFLLMLVALFVIRQLHDRLKVNIASHFAQNVHVLIN